MLGAGKLSGDCRQQQLLFRLKKKTLVAAFLARQVDGMSADWRDCTPNVSKQMLMSHAVPVVETWAIPQVPIDMSVGFSNFEAARQMTHYLDQHRDTKKSASSQHRRKTTTAQSERLARAIKWRSVKQVETSDTSLILESPFGLRCGSDALNTLLEASSGHQGGFLCQRHLSGRSPVLECRRRGLAVPERTCCRRVSTIWR